MNPLPACMVTAVLNKAGAATSRLFARLQPAGVASADLVSGRSSYLEERKAWAALFSSRPFLMNDSVDIVSFLAPPEQEEAAVQLVVETCGLHQPGRGSVYSKEIQVLQSHPACRPGHCRLVFTGQPYPTYTELAGLCCIVQRGQGGQIARAVLESGAGVPFIFFGEGTGLRDKLGLLRITIAAEKEVLRLVTGASHADHLLERLVQVGKLDQPGKGFIYRCPIQRGLLDTRLSVGGDRHAASMEQVIAAMDELKGGVEWRSSQQSKKHRPQPGREYLHNLADLTLVCNEGRAADLVKAAMACGAAGATLNKSKHVNLNPGAGPQKISPARETCSMIIAETLVPAVMAALEKAGAYDDRTAGQLQVRPIPKACTYLGK